MEQDAARAAAVADVSGKTAVLLVVGIDRTDADPFRAGRVLLCIVQVDLLDLILAGRRRDRAAQFRLPGQARARVVADCLAALAAVVVGDRFVVLRANFPSSNTQRAEAKHQQGFLPRPTVHRSPPIRFVFPRSGCLIPSTEF
jgi:hypothetical protein